MLEAFFYDLIISPRFSTVRSGPAFFITVLTVYHSWQLFG
jgi:hypothetical protein